MVRFMGKLIEPQSTGYKDKVRKLDADIVNFITLSMFLSWFLQEMVGSSSRVYCIFARATNSYVFI